MHHSPPITWILVCDSGQARLFYNRGANDGVHEMLDEEQDLSKITDLMTGKRGRNTPANNMFQMRHAYEPPTDPRKKEKHDFVQHVAEQINRREKAFDRLVVVAAPAALHVLREELSQQVKPKIIAEIDKDLTKETEQSLPAFLKDHMKLYDHENDFRAYRASQAGAS